MYNQTVHLSMYNAYSEYFLHAQISMFSGDIRYKTPVFIKKTHPLPLLFMLVSIVHDHWQPVNSAIVHSIEDGVIKS